jgi:hypothetical protein
MFGPEALHYFTHVTHTAIHVTETFQFRLLLDSSPSQGPASRLGWGAGLRKEGEELSPAESECP